MASNSHSVRAPLPASLLKLRAHMHPGHAYGVLPLPPGPLTNALPDHGLLRGAVSELSSAPSQGLLTTIALQACAAAQRPGPSLKTEMPWCAWLDPSQSLFAPGVAAHGVTLERLLVVRPDPQSLARVALRVVESSAFSVIVIDTLGVLGLELSVPLSRWPNLVRRFSLSAQKNGSCVLLLTNRDASEHARLPVASRIDLTRLPNQQLRVHVRKDRRGRFFSPQLVTLSS